MPRPWTTPHYVTLATLSLTLACSSAAPGDTEAGSSTSSGTTAEQTTQSSITSTLPTTGDDTASTDGPVTTSGNTTDASASTGPGTSTDESASSTTASDTTTTGETTGTSTGDTTGDTSTGDTGTSGSSSTGEPEASCVDTMLNQDETDVDCGGSCPVCDDGKNCLVDLDCSSNDCTKNVCAAAACDDLQKNGAETDIDCGGPDCLPCADGQACGVGLDCASQACLENLCASPKCDDTVKNGAETDIDCGGPDCATCADGGACLMNLDCASGVCTVDTCTGASCFDGLKNGEETQVDCGGPACAPCQLQTLVINEVDYDQPDTDTAEFIEIFNNTGAAVDLANIEVRYVNGSNKAVYETIKLGPGMLAQGQYLVIAPAGFVVPPNTVFIASAKAIQNGDPDGLALVDVGNKVVLDALSYGGAITQAVLGAPFPVTSLVEGVALPAATKDNSDPSRSLARLPNGNDKNNAATDWAVTKILTPGAANQP